MTEWRVQYGDPANDNYEENLIDVEITTNANPYGDSGTAYISDVDGDSVEEYPPRQRVQFQAREFGSGSGWTTVLDGYCVEPRERTEDGADRLEVSVYSLDSLLRNGDMNGDLSGQNIVTALDNLITNWVDGVNWNASKVVPDNPNLNLNRSYQNELVDNIIKSIRRRSAGEEFGVDETFDFYFRPAETKTVDRGIGPGDWNNYEIPEKAEDALNEVRVFYDDGDRAVIVDDTGDKREIQSNLGTTEPVTQAESIMRKQITTRADAVAAGEEYLADRGVPKEIQVETYGLIGANPGDTINIRIPSAAINDEYRIAQLEYTMPDTTTVTALREQALSQKSESSTSDMLVRASDSLQRVEMRPARQDSDLEETVRVIETLVGVDVGIGGTVGGVQLDTFAITNDGWSALIDAYLDTATITIQNVVIGTADADAQRTDSALGSQSESETATVTASGDFDVDITNGTGFSTGDTIHEVGLEDSNNNLIMRATLAEGVSGPTDATITLSVSNDTDIDNGIVTETGQTLVRDILAASSPVPPQDFAVGDTDPTNQGSSYDDETRTSLSATNNNNDTYARELGNEIVEDEGTTDGLSNLVDGTSGAIANGGVTIRDDAIELDQAAWVWDSEESDLYPQKTVDSLYTGGEAANFATRTGDQMIFQFTSDRTIDSGDVYLAIHAKASTSGQKIYMDLNGEGGNVSIPTSLGWVGFSVPVEITEDQNQLVVLPDYETTTDVDIDVVAVYDNSNVVGGPGTWNSDNGGSGGYLDDPKLYPDTKLVNLGSGSDINLAEEVDDASVALSINDFTGTQYIEIEGGKTNNTSSASETFTATDQLSVTFALSNYGTGRSATPTEGYNGQVIDNVQITTGKATIGSTAGSRSLNLQSYFGPGVIPGGTNIKEAGVRNNQGDLISYSDVSFTSEPALTIALSETLRFRRKRLAVNESDFDVTITDLNGVDSSGAYYQVSITDTESTV